MQPVGRMQWNLDECLEGVTLNRSTVLVSEKWRLDDQD
jgi:hypothetical protein